MEIVCQMYVKSTNTSKAFPNMQDSPEVYDLLVIKQKSFKALQFSYIEEIVYAFISVEFHVKANKDLLRYCYTLSYYSYVLSAVSFSL